MSKAKQNQKVGAAPEAPRKKPSNYSPPATATNAAPPFDKQVRTLFGLDEPSAPAGKTAHTQDRLMPQSVRHEYVRSLERQRDELLAAFQPIWRAWHTVPYDNKSMNKAVRAMFSATVKYDNETLAKAEGRVS